MKFMDLISEKECHLKKYVKEYGGQTFIVLGAGHGARGIVRYLKEHGVSEFKVCVDDEYWKEGMHFEGYDVEALGELLKNALHAYDIIIGFSSYDVCSTDKYKRQYPDAIRNVIHYDIFPHFWMEPQIYSIDRVYYEEKNEDLTKVYHLLEDDFSKKVLISFVEQRISGDFKYAEGIVSELSERYFDSEIMPLDSNITLIDCGAFEGEDTMNFFERYNDNLFSFVIEPDKDNIEVARNNLRMYKNNVDFVERVVLDKEVSVNFLSGGEGSGISDSNGYTVQGTSLDMLYRENMKRFDNDHVIIKMDIEGTELKALQGAEKLIRQKSPILVICVYHKQEDIIELPLYIRQLNPNYKIYMRRYNNSFVDTVIYAMPKR